jgi:hypothetical protein
LRHKALEKFKCHSSLTPFTPLLRLRLNEPLTGELLADINTEFADLLATGQFEQTDALPAEHDDPNLLAKPRLVFHFARRSFGR